MVLSASTARALRYADTRIIKPDWLQHPLEKTGARTLRPRRSDQPSD